MKYIDNISNSLCSGELWSSKFKKYIKLLSLSKDLYADDINKKLDEIWKVRNDIAHANTNILILNYDKVTYKYNKRIGVGEYTQFALMFIKLVDDVIDFLTKVDKLSLEKWETTDNTLLLYCIKNRL